MSDPSRELIEQAAAIGVELSGSSSDRLLRYEELLRDRGVPLGLVAKGDVARIRERHILDCLRAAPLVGPGARRAYDLGSGGGLPGIVLGIALPHLQVTCVEARRNRVAFLELAIDLVGLPNASAHLGPLEELTEVVDVCFARALASPEGSWRMAERLLDSGGKLIYFAGKGFHAVAEDRPGSAAEVAGAAPWGNSGVRMTTVPTPGLESSGPLVIMGRP